MPKTPRRRVEPYLFTNSSNGDEVSTASGGLLHARNDILIGSLTRQAVASVVLASVACPELGHVDAAAFVTPGSDIGIDFVRRAHAHQRHVDQRVGETDRGGGGGVLG